MKMNLDKVAVKKFVNMKRSEAMKNKAKFIILPKRRSDGQDLTINFKEAEEMVKKNDFSMEVE